MATDRVVHLVSADNAFYENRSRAKLAGALRAELTTARKDVHIHSSLRVRLRALSRIAELSQHEADGRKFQKREGVAVEIFPILGETTAPVEPSDRAFDDPTLGQSHESFGVIGSSDDFGFEMRQGFGERVRKNRALIGAVGKQLLEEWKLTEQRGQQQDAAIAILDAGGMHDGVQQ